MARWGSWGAQGLSQIFDEQRGEHADDRALLRSLLNEAEYEAARRTTINAHYTDAAIAGEMWDSLSRLGFDGGEVLEPGCGAGVFLGLAPGTARMTGVELDPITAGIAGQLYPQAEVRQEPFQATRIRDGRFDAVIGNVPFADVTLHDPLHNPGGLAMHNHFIVKSLALTRPGGLVAVLTSRYTMDAQNPAGRRAMYELGDLVGAVRLPTGAHRRAAGTEAVTDLLILRRREPGRAPQPFDWAATSPVDLPGPGGAPEPARINNWWQQHPDQVLGQLRAEVGLHGVVGVSVIATDLGRTAAELREALDRIEAEAAVTGLRWSPRTAEQQAETEQQAGRMPAATDERDGHITAHEDGTFTIVEEGAHAPLVVPKSAAAEMRVLLTLRDQARGLLEVEAQSLQETSALEQARQELRTTWEGYRDRWGPINRYKLSPTGKVNEEGEPTFRRLVPTPVRKLMQDPFGPLVTALESFDEATQEVAPAGILLQRQIEPRRPVLGTENAADALNVVLDRTQEVDLEAIADLAGLTVDAARAELGEAIWEDPAVPGEWVTRAEYLSGDVREKLAVAREAAVDDPDRWNGNVAALQAVQPVDLGPAEIQPRLGAAWISEADHQQFLRELVGDRQATVSRIGSSWSVKGGEYGLAATSDWGTREMPAGKLMEHLIEQSRIVITDKVDERRVVNPIKTEAAQEKGRAMQERFATWLWEDPERTSRLCAEYNRRFNSVVLRDYTAEGERLTLPGLVRSFTPRPHQRAAVARMINEPSVGLFHAVGAGKTAEMVMGCTELRRLGLIRKPAVVVPNHMLEQFTREWLQLYPRASLLAASSSDISGPDDRRQFVARAAANEWDAVIMTHDAFGRLSMSPQGQAAYMRREIENLRVDLEAARSTASGAAAERTIKQVEKTLLTREEKIKAKLSGAHDPGITFEATGIDYVVVDEMHLFKNLATVSNIRGAAIAGSNRASDLHMKVDYLRSKHGDRVMTGATATPISNSMAEMHVVMRYLAPEQLEKAGIESFDRWAATFGEVVTSLEIPVSGGTKFVPKDRFAKFVNVPELVHMLHQFADIKTTADLGLPAPPLAPRASDGRRAPNIITVEPSPELDDFMADLAWRTDRVKSGAVDPTEDNNLKISVDGRKASIDVRVVDPTTLPTGPTKTSAAADLIHGVWERTKDNRYVDVVTGELHPTPGALQIVFCDFSTPSDGWNIYEALRDALYNRGLPIGSVRFIHEASNDREKARLFAQCRTGGVAVLIGSTSKMGVGTNIQARAVHLVDLDAPWRPADIEQRHGRILRQGNQNDQVLISQVITAGSFDTFMWQTLERKARFIDQVMRNHGTAREVEGDADEVQMSYSELKAISSRNPLLLELSSAEHELQRLRRLHTAHQNNQHHLALTASHGEQQLVNLRAELPVLQGAAGRTVDTRGDAFRMTITGSSYSKRSAAAAALNTWVRANLIGYPAQVDLGTPVKVGGHDIRVTRDADNVIWTVEGTPVRMFDPIKDLRHGTDQGHVTRLENLVRRLPGQLDTHQATIEQTEQRVSHARAGIGAPFKHAAELTEAERRYSALTDKVNQQAGQESAETNPETTPHGELPAEIQPVDDQLRQLVALVQTGFGRPPASTEPETTPAAGRPVARRSLDTDRTPGR